MYCSKRYVLVLLCEAVECEMRYRIGCDKTRALPGTNNKPQTEDMVLVNTKTCDDSWTCVARANVVQTLEEAERWRLPFHDMRCEENAFRDSTQGHVPTCRLLSFGHSGRLMPPRS